MRKNQCLTFACFVAVGLTVKGQVLFEEDFTNYGETASGMVSKEGLRLGNDPIWSCSADLSVRPKEDFALYEKPIALAADGNFDLCFDFRFLNASTNNPCSFNLVLGDGKKTCMVPVSSLSVAGFAQESQIPNRVWKGLLVKSTGEKGEVYLATDRKFSRLGDIAFGFKPTEFNFSVVSNCEFGLTHIKATTPEAVPEFPASAHFASFKSLSQSIPGAMRGGSVTIDPPEGGRQGVTFQPCGTNGLGKASVTFEDGSVKVFPLEITSQTQNLRADMLGKKKKDRVVLPDCGLKICGVTQYVRPNLKQFQSSYSIEPQGVDVLRDWDLLPSASRHTYKVDFVRRDGKLQLWIDGSYIQTIEQAQKVTKGEPPKPALQAKSVVFNFGEGILHAMRPSPLKQSGYTSLDLSANPKAKAFADGELVGIEPGTIVLDGYPMQVVRPIDSADISICHQAMGNCSAGMGAAVWPLRNGASPDSFDYLGMESPAQVIPTERLSEVGLLGMLVSQDAASRLAKKKVHLNGAWEFTYRADRDCGEELQAEWHTRDNLVCLAHDFKLISPGILFDCCNGYYNGLWGGAGLLRRAPYVYPKRAYVAYAVLTKVLDDVVFAGSVPTGSGSAYAYQYKRADGKWVTALWFHRGEGEMEVESVGGTLTKMYGQESNLPGGKTVVAVSRAPIYLTTDKPLTDVKIVGREFRQDMSLASRAKVASSLDRSDLFEPLSPDPQMESVHHEFFPYLKPSKYAMTTATDEEKGSCIELRLDPANEQKYTEYVTEYTTLRFKEPVAIEGEPELLGVWVKGNSNGGQIRFEIEDADGEVFKNLSTGRDWACDVMDWPGNLAVGFDGWSFVYQTLRPTDLIPTHSPGPYKEQWVSCGGDKKIRFPIKVCAITVGSLRHLFTPLGFDLSKQIEAPLRLKNLGGVYR